MTLTHTRYLALPRRLFLCSTIPRPTVLAMARITVEDCLNHVSSRFELVMLASKRARQLLKGAKPLVDSNNRDIVIALREIAAGKSTVPYH